MKRFYCPDSPPSGPAVRLRESVPFHQHVDRYKTHPFRLFCLLRLFRLCENSFSMSRNTKSLRAPSSRLTPEDIDLATQSRNVFSRHTDRSGTMKFVFQQRKGSEAVVIPKTAARLFHTILVHLSEGEMVSVTTQHREISSQQGADLLNVSRPYFVKLLDTGKIPHRKVGSHRRVYAKDVLRYKKSLEAARVRSLNELTKQAQELGMGY